MKLSLLDGNLDGEVAVWGASKLGRFCIDELRSHGIKVNQVLDGDKNKWGSTFEGLVVSAPRHYDNSNINLILVVASQYWNQIVAQAFKELKFDRVFVFSSPLGAAQPTLIELRRDCDSRNRFDICFVQANYSGSNSWALYKHVTTVHPELNSTLIQRNGLDPDSLNRARSSKLHFVTHEYDFFEDIPSIQAYHGFPLKGIGAMSRYQSLNSINNTKRAWEKHRSILSYSSAYTSLMSACFGGTHLSYKITGMPRNDLLKDTKKSRQLLEKIFPELSTFDCIGFYAPTFRETKFGQVNGVPVTGFLPDSINEYAVSEFCEKRRIALIKKSHPYEFEGISNERPGLFCLDDNTLERYELDLYEVLGAFDFLVTDYSSIYFDFLLLNRPIGFISYDLEEYSSTRGFLISPYDFWAPGAQIHSTNELLEFLTSVLCESDAFCKQRNDVGRIVHDYQDFSSCERAMEKIVREIET